MVWGFARVVLWPMQYGRYHLESDLLLQWTDPIQSIPSLHLPHNGTSPDTFASSCLKAMVAAPRAPLPMPGTPAPDNPDLSFAFLRRTKDIVSPSANRSRVQEDPPPTYRV